MEIAVYQSERGEIVLVPACTRPNRQAKAAFGMLYRRGQFDAGDCGPIIDLDALVESGYIHVTPAQMVLLRRVLPA